MNLTTSQMIGVMIVVLVISLVVGDYLRNLSKSIQSTQSISSCYSWKLDSYWNGTSIENTIRVGSVISDFELRSYRLTYLIDQKKLRDNLNITDITVFIKDDKSQIDISYLDRPDQYFNYVCHSWVETFNRSDSIRLGVPTA